jgi:hypothetical protein
MACLVAILQQTLEKYSCPQERSLEPTHWIKAIFFKSFNSGSVEGIFPGRIGSQDRCPLLPGDWRHTPIFD